MMIYKIPKLQVYAQCRSVWRPRLRAARLCLAAVALVCLCSAPALGVGARSIAIVQGTSSTPNDAERNYSRSVSDRLERLLKRSGLVAQRLTDEDVVHGKLSGHRIAILAYNPTLPSGALKRIQSFVAGGGRLIVFYSADPRLAALMDVRLGTYKVDPRVQTWCAMRFTAPGDLHVPARVRQRSRNVRPVFPVTSSSSRIIAFWENTHGGLTPDPAWVQSPNGFWMSHVMLDDGDTDAKSNLLVGLLAALDPTMWKRVAEHAQAQAVASTALAADVREAARGSARSRTVLAVLDSAERLRQTAVSLQREKQYPRAVQAWRDYRHRLLMAYGGVNAPAPDLFRGVWEHSGAGIYPGDWGRTCAAVADAGLTDILTNVSWPGKAHYASALVPRSKTFALWGDQLSQALTAARTHDLNLHVWKVCWRLDGAPEALLASLRKAKRLQQTADGRTLNWLCPSDDRNLAYEKDAVRELLRNYAVDGLHLDYIRYPDSGSCYCSGCRTRFEKVHGRRMSHWPGDVTPGGPVRGAYNSWRVAQITRLVRDVSAIVKKTRPQARLSAAVYGKYPMCVASVAQDWGDWLKKGYVDFICPMNYTDELERFTGYTTPQLALPTQGGHVFPGIGVTATESRLDAVSTIQQINRAHALGARGFTLYELNPVLEREIFPVLKLGVTRKK